jgi:hypothetical protein
MDQSQGIWARSCKMMARRRAIAGFCRCSRSHVGRDGAGLMYPAAKERDVRRVYRSSIGDWCVDISMTGGWIHNAVFDHHPSVALLRLLKNEGADIADEVITEGAEGVDICRRAQENEP